MFTHKYMQHKNEQSTTTHKNINASHKHNIVRKKPDKIVHATQFNFSKGQKQVM